MKKNITLFLIMAISAFNYSYAQEKVDQFVIIKDLPFGTYSKNQLKEVIVDYGSSAGYKDSTVIGKIEKVKSYRSEAGILNYMSLQDWTLVNSMAGPSEMIFIFKKSFYKSELLPVAPSSK